MTERICPKSDGCMVMAILAGSLPVITRCCDCKWLGRESVVAGEYRCNRTERVTTLDDYCSKAVRRDAD